jgi:prepilin-type N-terminal cleavage/methylation domain-containing protein
MIFMRVRERGYTLAEIIVVIAVIAVLATIVWGAADAYRKKARDTERRSELKQIELALRMYKDSYGRYPASGCGAGTLYASPGPGNTNWYVSCDQYITGLVPSIMNALPTDPKESVMNQGYMYRTNVAGTEYKVMSHGSVESRVITAGEVMARCPASCLASNPSCTQRTYAVYSPGAACW